MRFVEPKIFLIFKSVAQNAAIARWLDHIGCSEDVADKYAFGSDDKTDAERLIELAGRRCYLSFETGINPNVTRIRADIADYITNIMKSGHGSVLEHAYYTFAIEGVSRVFTGEMNRHRAGVAISEGSMRYIRYSDIPFVEVPSIVERTGDYSIAEIEKVAQTRDYISRCVSVIETFYDSLVRTWQDVLEGPDFAGKKHITSMLRRIAPMGIATGGVWTFNIRALRHMLTMRCAEAAEEEICRVATMMLEVMMREEPTLFGDFKKDEKGFWAPIYKKV